MSNPTPAPGKGKGGREDEDDQDLLTFGEVAARISEELQLEQGRLAQLQESEADQEKIARSAHRVQLLLDARSRNSRGASDDTFADFFGYRPGQHP